MIAPLAFCLGMPFPSGWPPSPVAPKGWCRGLGGINGFASVVATLLATLLAIHFGQAAVMLLAVAIYGVAAWQFPRED